MMLGSNIWNPAILASFNMRVKGVLSAVEVAGLVSLCWVGVAVEASQQLEPCWCCGYVRWLSDLAAPNSVQPPTVCVFGGAPAPPVSLKTTPKADTESIARQW